MALPNTLPEIQKVVLRPYQDEMVKSWQAAMDRGVQRGLIVAATGTGKTTVFSSIIDAMAEGDPGFTGLVLAHRQELLEQAANRIRSMVELDVCIHSGISKARPGSNVVVGSVQSLGRSGADPVPWLSPQLVIVDEAHHAAAATYQECFRNNGCYDEGGTFLLGVTATPHRLDNLALYGSEKAIFQEVVFKYDIVQAIKDGYLADLRGFRAKADFDLSDVKTVAGDYNQGQLERKMNTSPVNELAFKSWADVAADRPSIVFCAGVDHAKAMAEVFIANGITAAAVYGDMPKPAREKAIRDFQEGRIQVLTNMDILTEGFDAQHCACIVLLRPTQSWSLFTQMVGRGLRTLPGVIDGIHGTEERRAAVKASRKPDCIVVDIVGNTELHGVSKSPKSKDIPSLQALVGLPDAMDLEGKTLAESVEEFEGLPEVVKAAAFRRNTSFSGLTQALTQVEMIAELEMPDEAVQSGANLYWLKVGEGHYMLDVGGRGDEEKGRRCDLTRDMLGNWTLTMLSNHRNEPIELGNDSETVFERAEQRVKNEFFGVSRLAGRDAAWRNTPPTDKQKQFLKALGVHEEVIDHLDRGKASSMITVMKMKGGGR